MDRSLRARGSIRWRAFRGARRTRAYTRAVARSRRTRAIPCALAPACVAARDRVRACARTRAGVRGRARASTPFGK
jgi:hypothetical protein